MLQVVNYLWHDLTSAITSFPSAPSDVSTFIYDPDTGNYFDPISGVYYDPNTQVSVRTYVFNLV